MSITDKKLLIVGAGFGQLPAIIKARKLGLKTIVIDKNPNALGMKLVTNSYPIDIIDKKHVYQLAKNENIDGIMTMQTDLPVPIIGYINDKLSLTGINYNAAIDCSIKTNTRLLLEKKGIPQPIFEIVNTIEQAIIACEKIDYPVIIKAIDSSGSRGVTKVKSTNDIKRAFKEARKYSKQKDILVEEYIEGVEIGAQAFSENGKCISVLVHNDTIASGDYMVPTGHSFPSFLTKNQLEITIKDIKRCVEALNINDGPSNIDIIIDNKDGFSKIIEVGARIGATCLPELVKYHTSIDWVKQTIINALGIKVSLNIAANNAVAAEILHANDDGILKNIIIPDIVKNHIDLLELEITAKIGDEVSKLRKGTDRIGKIICKGITWKDAERITKELKSKIIFIVE